jgi:Holliday junction resolvasome RuvABC DNA-binding subunit
MINYLKGQCISVGKNFQNRMMLILEVNQTGYEIQIPSSFAHSLTPDTQEMIQILPIFMSEKINNNFLVLSLLLNGICLLN